MIGAITAGSGKTLFAMGLIRALQKRGLKVQPYKCGTDFMDAQFLSLVADYETVHLDTWMASYTHVQHLYNKYGEKADVCVVDGSGGLYDGIRKMQGSNVDMAKLLDIPVVLLVNARAVGYSVAPVIYGFKKFCPSLKIAGVVFNQVSSQAHYALLKEACLDAGVDTLGYLCFSEEWKLPSKHTGLTLTVKKELDEKIEKLSEQIVNQVDISRLMSKCNGGFPCRYMLPYSSDTEFDSFVTPIRKIKIAVARDAAFNFTYRENIASLKRIGEITYFSPVYGSDLPEADLVYLPSGFPELFARQLHRRRKLMDDLKAFAERGGMILAEGGGTIFLSRSLTVRQGGTAYAMSGVFPFDFELTANRIQTKYRKYEMAGMELKGHDYRYFQIPDCVATDSIMRYKNVIACCGHLYWGETDIMKWWN